MLHLTPTCLWTTILDCIQVCLPFWFFFPLTEGPAWFVFCLKTDSCVNFSVGVQIFIQIWHTEKQAQWIDRKKKERGKKTHTHCDCPPMTHLWPKADTFLFLLHHFFFSLLCIKLLSHQMHLLHVKLSITMLFDQIKMINILVTLYMWIFLYVSAFWQFVSFEVEGRGVMCDFSANMSDFKITAINVSSV